MKKTAACLSIVATIGMGCLLASAWGQSEETVSLFKGRVIVILSKSIDESGVILLDPANKKIGQVDFLVGAAADSGHPDDWTKGRIVWMPIDDIAQLVEFKSIEDARESGVMSREND